MLAQIGGLAEEMDAVLTQAVGRLAEKGMIDAERVASFAAYLRGLAFIHILDFVYRGEALGPDTAARLVTDLLRGFGQDWSTAT